jgi:chromate reductase, NAD(P)H dehydrogenase (quinone)
MHVFVMAASLRRASFNRKLAGIAAQIARTCGVEVELADFADYLMPLYDGDSESSSGMPDGARMLSTHIKTADALIFSAPEYNNSISGPFKNAIDWLSREKPYPLVGKPLLLMAASSGRGAGLVGLAAGRIPLAYLGAHVYPGTLGVGLGATAFAEDGSRLKDDGMQKSLEILVADFLAHAARTAPARRPTTKT